MRNIFNTDSSIPYFYAMSIYRAEIYAFFNFPYSVSTHLSGCRAGVPAFLGYPFGVGFCLRTKTNECCCPSKAYDGSTALAPAPSILSAPRASLSSFSASGPLRAISVPPVFTSGRVSSASTDIRATALESAISNFSL